LFTLGLSAYSHDSAACLVGNGRVIAAVEEERLSRIKHTGDFPRFSANFCVQKGGIGFLDLSQIAISEKPYLKFARVVLDHVHAFPRSLPNFLRSFPDWLDQRLSIPFFLEQEMGIKKKVYFVPHHLSHAASAFYPSSFESAAILTVDGVGEWSAIARGLGEGNRIRLNKEQLYPHSLGLIYTCVTVFLGFQAHGDEGKTMALAALGEPSFLPELKKLIHIKPDGSFLLDQEAFSFSSGRKMWGRKFEKIFGQPKAASEPFEKRHFDLAASLQSLLEEILISVCRDLHQETGQRSLCLAGGVALNCLANQKILEETPFERIFVQPAAGDSGGSVGAALFVQNGLNKIKRHPMTDAYWGPEFSNHEIQVALERAGLAFLKCDREDLLSLVAEEIQGGAIVGWFQGAIEFGPRALGHRSILANPLRKETKDTLNRRIKDRLDFQPFAPVVIAEKARKYFALKQDSPFMLQAPKIRPEFLEQLPSIAHADGTARVQTVDRFSNSLIYDLLLKFEAASGFPILVNTSFNGRGEPIVCTPDDAVRCFLRNGLDLLAIGNFLVKRETVARNLPISGAK
jgi:carbamoyltransferase